MLCVIIVNYFSSDEINSNLKRYASYANDIKNEIKFIIIDNSGEFSISNDVDSNSVIVLNSGENLGYCGGNNLGYKYIKTNMSDSDILICNPDVKIDFFQLEKMIDIIASNDNGLYSIPAVNEHNDLLYYNIKLKGLLESCIRVKPDKKIIDTDYCPGSYLYIKTDNHCLEYLFDDSFFMYWEEVDLALRLKEKSLSSFMINNIGYIERHSNDESRIYNAIYYHMRNSFLLKKRHEKYITNCDFFLFIIVKLFVFLKKSIINLDLKYLTCYFNGVYDGIRGKKGARR